MKPYFRFSFWLLMFCFIFVNNSYAKLEFGGIILAELINDPQNFNPTVSRNPWLSGDKGGIIVPGYYVGHFTKINLNLLVTDKQVEAYLPLTIGLNPISSVEWQTYLVADDYLNIPYFLSMKAPVFTFSASSKPIGDKRFGFMDFKDPFGVIRSPNSTQPILTFKVDAELPKNYTGRAYVLLDQLVGGIPIWEKLPESILNETVKTKQISEYGFTDEIAQYNLARIEGNLNEKTRFGFFVGQKNVENPSFRWKNADNSLSPSEVFQRWGYVKSNYGFDFKANIGSNINITSAAVGSNVKWYKYDTQRIIEDTGFFARRWYPSELKGELSGLAGSFLANYKFGSNNIALDCLIIEPDFQAVGAVHDQFSPMIRFVPRSEQDPILERRTQIFFEPTGELSGKTVSSSQVVDYIGRRKIGVTFTKDGVFGSFPIVFAIQGQEVSALGEPIKEHKDPRTGAYLISDYRGVYSNVAYRGARDSWILEGKNYRYLANADYYRSLGTSYEHRWGNNAISANLEKVWRLKELGQKNNNGSALKLTTFLKGSLIGKTKYLLSLDIRQGDYDYDLIETISDQVVSVYSYLGLSAYLEKNYEFTFKNGVGKLTLAGELVRRETDLEDVNTGKSIIGYFNSIVPLGEKWSCVATNIFVNGPESLEFPSGRIKNINHNELAYRPSADTLIRLGCTTIGRETQNSFAALRMIVGKGNLSISIGRGSAPVFQDGINLPGTLTRQGFYHSEYLPSQLLSQRPWEPWDKNNFYALWQNQLRSTEASWAGYVTISYWLSF
jgi:hypothetical protein